MLTEGMWCSPLQSCWHRMPWGAVGCSQGAGLRDAGLGGSPGLTPLGCPSRGDLSVPSACLLIQGSSEAHSPGWYIKWSLSLFPFQDVIYYDFFSFSLSRFSTFPLSPVCQWQPVLQLVSPWGDSGVMSLLRNVSSAAAVAQGTSVSLVLQSQAETGEHSQEERSCLHRYTETKDIYQVVICEGGRGKIIPIWVVNNASYLKTNYFFPLDWRWHWALKVKKEYVGILNLVRKHLQTLIFKETWIWLKKMMIF